MILCTVKDDLHDIGKNIVKAMLEAGGFEVIDLGIDVPPEKVVESCKTGKYQDHRIVRCADTGTGFYEKYHQRICRRRYA